MHGSGSVLRLFAPAKINLHLRVAPVRADGFHPILSWMTTVQLSDVLDIAAGPRGGVLELTCDDSTIPTDDRNLIVRVWKQLLDSGLDRPVFEDDPDSLRDSNGAGAVGQPPGLQGARVALTKRIPAGGGLGGASSDAVAALDGFLRMNGRDWDAERRKTFLSKIGSDLPFFLHAPSAVCKGRGEIVEPVPVPGAARWAVLMFPDFGLPTPAVYRRFDEMRLGRADDLASKPDWNVWAELPSMELLGRLVNDLEPPAFNLRPELAELQANAEKQLHRPVRMSGSGSTLFTLFDEASEAHLATQKLTIRSIAVELGLNDENV